MSRGRTGNKIWQLITFSWHTLLWIVNGTSDLIGQLDSREPIILLWSTHVTTRSTSETIQLGRTTRYRERNTNDKENNGGGRGRGEGRGERSKCAVFLLTFLDFICAPIEFIWLLNQSKKWCLSERNGILKYWTVVFLSIRQCHPVAISTCPGDILQRPMETLKQDCKPKLKIKQLKADDNRRSPLFDWGVRGRRGSNGLFKLRSAAKIIFISVLYPLLKLIDRETTFAWQKKNQSMFISPVQVLASPEFIRVFFPVSCCMHYC